MNTSIRVTNARSKIPGWRSNVVELGGMNFQFKIHLSLFFILFSLQVCSQAMAGGDRVGQQIRALKDENSLLEAELRLASKGTSYIILDLRTDSDPVPARINLKHRGIVLRAFDIERVRYRNTKRLAVEPIPLVKKMAFFPPKRKEIKPQKPEESDDTIHYLDFLELKDVPSIYTLSFGKGLLLSVTGRPKGCVSKVIRVIRSVFIHIRYSLAILWNHLWNKEFGILEITMAKEDAQALYWSLEEGMSIVVVTPPGTLFNCQMASLTYRDGFR